MSPVFGFADRRLNPVAIVTIGFPSIWLGPSYITRPCGRLRRSAMLLTPIQLVATPLGCWDNARGTSCAERSALQLAIIEAFKALSIAVDRQKCLEIWRQTRAAVPHFGAPTALNRQAKTGTPEGVEGARGTKFSRSSRAVTDACDAQDLFELDYLETFAK